MDAAEIVERDAIARALGVRVDPDGTTLRMTATAEQVNAHGTVHGSVVFALADVAFAIACNAPGPLAVGRSCSIEYLAPGRPGDELVATVTERTRQGRTGVYDVAVTRGGDGALLAELRGVSRVLR